MKSMQSFLQRWIKRVQSLTMNCLWTMDTSWVELRIQQYAWHTAAIRSTILHIVIQFYPLSRCNNCHTRPRRLNMICNTRQHATTSTMLRVKRWQPINKVTGLSVVKYNGKATCMQSRASGQIILTKMLFWNLNWFTSVSLNMILWKM